MKKGKECEYPIRVYLGLVFFICYGLGMLEFITGTGKLYHFLGIAFTFLPVLLTFITCRITGKRGKFHLSLKVWKDSKSWLFSAFVPGILIVLGVVLYFLVFPNEYSGVFRYGMHLGTNEEVFINLPLIYFGFNYSLDNPGAPYTNMALMLLTCVILGIMFSYITIRTENCMYAAIMHGVVNIIGELPVYMTHDMKNGLLGPNPTGLLAMSFLAAFAILLFIKMKD